MKHPAIATARDGWRRGWGMCFKSGRSRVRFMWCELVSHYHSLQAEATQKWSSRKFFQATRFNTFERANKYQFFASLLDEIPTLENLIKALVKNFLAPDCHSWYESHLLLPPENESLGGTSRGSSQKWVKLHQSEQNGTFAVISKFIPLKQKWSNPYWAVIL